MTRSDAGFSLLEALVALFIVGLLSSAGLAIMSTTLDGHERIDESGAAAASVERAHAMLKADLSQLVYRPSRDADGASRTHVFRGGFEREGEPFLAFARAGRENPGGAEPRGSTAYVEYLLRGGRLVRRMALRTDPARETPVVETVLLEDVEQVEVAFRAGAGWSEVYALSAAGRFGAPFPRAVEVAVERRNAGVIRAMFLTGVEP